MSRAWVRGLPTSPIMSAMGQAGVTRFGSVVSYRRWEAFARLGPRSSTVSDHERVWGRWVSRGPGPWSPVISDHERQGVERVSRAWIRGLPWSPTMSAMGPGGCRAVRVRGGASAISAGVTRSGFMVSRGSIMGLAGVTRPGSVIFMVSDRGREGVALGSVDLRGLRS